MNNLKYGRIKIFLLIIVAIISCNAIINVANQGRFDSFSSGPHKTVNVLMVIVVILTIVLCIFSYRFSFIELSRKIFPFFLELVLMLIIVSGGIFGGIIGLNIARNIFGILLGAVVGVILGFIMMVFFGGIISTFLELNENIKLLNDKDK